MTASERQHQVTRFIAVIYIVLFLISAGLVLVIFNNDTGALSEDAAKLGITVEFILLLLIPATIATVSVLFLIYGDSAHSMFKAFVYGYALLFPIGTVLAALLFLSQADGSRTSTQSDAA